MKTEKIYGNAPHDMGHFSLNNDEMMFWLYCPVKTPHNKLIIPDNLKKFEPLLERISESLHEDMWNRSYVYLTAKTIYQTPENPGNRPGWHSDGFLSDDLNYIWSDRNPTIYYDDGNLHQFTKDHNGSIPEMDSLCEPAKEHWFKCKEKHLYLLDESVLHKVDTDIQPGLRTFVKVSVSDHVYALKGNSINHEIDLGKYSERADERNCPISS